MVKAARENKVRGPRKSWRPNRIPVPCFPPHLISQYLISISADPRISRGAAALDPAPYFSAPYVPPPYFRERPVVNETGAMLYKPGHNPGTKHCNDSDETRCLVLTKCLGLTHPCPGISQGPITLRKQIFGLQDLLHVQ